VKRLLAATLFAASGFALATLAGWALRRRRSPKELLEAYLQAWEAGEPERLDGVVSDDYEGHVTAIAGTEARDRRELEEQIRAHAETYPARRFEIEECISNGTKVAARARMEGTHEDGRDVEMDGFLIVRTRNGRIAEEWASWDYLGIAAQLGVEVAVEPDAS